VLLQNFDDDILQILREGIIKNLVISGYSQPGFHPRRTRNVVPLLFKVMQNTVILKGLF
jgi:hypothetical protein